MDLNEIRPKKVGEMRRVGAKHDGGYVIPVMFPDTSTLISFGLGDDWKFEKFLTKEGTINLFVCYDHTVSLYALFKRLVKRLDFHNLSFGAIYYRTVVLIRYMRDFYFGKYFHIRKEITRDKNNNNQTNLLAISKNVTEKQFILKVDIEGNEYQIIDQIIYLVARIPLLIIEFHKTDTMRDVFEKSLNQLKQHFTICHTHANNFELVSADGIPTAIEFTFGRKDIYLGSGFVNNIPILGLDSPSSGKRPDFEISFSELD